MLGLRKWKQEEDQKVKVILGYIGSLGYIKFCQRERERENISCSFAAGNIYTFQPINLLLAV